MEPISGHMIVSHWRRGEVCFFPKCGVVLVLNALLLDP